MSKRSRGPDGRYLTGGTGDVKPQILTITTGTAGAINDYVINQVALPVPRFGARKDKATVFEFLRVDWFLGLQDAADTSNQKFGFLATVTSRSNGDTATAATAAADASDPLTFAFVYQQKELATQGANTTTYPVRVDLTDGAGNGVLVATDRLFIVGGDVAGATAASYTAKILYRLVDVGVTEYVGIVQSQQG